MQIPRTIHDHAQIDCGFSLIFCSLNRFVGRQALNLCLCSSIQIPRSADHCFLLCFERQCLILHFEDLAVPFPTTLHVLLVFARMLLLRCLIAIDVRPINISIEKQNQGRTMSFHLETNSRGSCIPTLRRIPNNPSS